MEKEKWISEIMDSLDESPKLVAPANLFEKIETQIKAKSVRAIPIRFVIGIAASFLVLVALNIQFITQSSNTNIESKHDSEISAYIELENNQLY